MVILKVDVDPPAPCMTCCDGNATWLLGACASRDLVHIHDHLYQGHSRVVTSSYIPSLSLSVLAGKGCVKLSIRVTYVSYTKISVLKAFMWPKHHFPIDQSLSLDCIIIVYHSFYFDTDESLYFCLRLYFSTCLKFHHPLEISGSLPAICSTRNMVGFISDVPSPILYVHSCGVPVLCLSK